MITFSIEKDPFDVLVNTIIRAFQRRDDHALGCGKELQNWLHHHDQLMGLAYTYCQFLISE